MIPLLRLFLDANEGVSTIPCGACGRPMLLAVERMGRMLVGYRGGFRIRPGHSALLVCSDINCDHQEAVEIARSPADAVAFSAIFASGWYQTEQRYWEMTLDEIQAECERLAELYRRTNNPRLPSAIRLWRRHYEMSYWRIHHDLETSLKENSEVICSFRESNLRGTVKAALKGAVIMNRSADGEPVLVRVGELHSVGHCMEWPRPKLDFGGHAVRLAPDNCIVSNPTRFVVYNGHPLALDSVTKYGICRVHTKNPEIGRALDLYPNRKGKYSGEFPSVLADRVYRVIHFCWVGKYRLHVESFTNDPYVLQLGTRDMEAAKALRMNRAMQFCGQRKAPRWWRYFDRTEITDEAEIEVAIRMPRARRR